jgi:hypothetical protein
MFFEIRAYRPASPAIFSSQILLDTRLSPLLLSLSGKRTRESTAEYSFSEAGFGSYCTPASGGRVWGGFFVFGGKFTALSLNFNESDQRWH